MARDHARVNVSIWGSSQFRSLSPQAQHLYFVLVTSSSLSYVGVADWRPKRLAALSDGWTVKAVERAGQELSAVGTVVIDEDTDEVLIRRWMKYDGLIGQPRMAVSVANAYAATASSPIRGVIVHELRRLREEEPNLKGWGQEKLQEVLNEPSKPPPETPDLAQTEVPFGPNQTSPTPAPAPSPSTPGSGHLQSTDQRSEHPRFEEFYSEYPRKVGRKKAETAFNAAVKSGVDPQKIIDAANLYAQSVQDSEKKFIAHPTTWLHAGRWDDEVELPPTGTEGTPSIWDQIQPRQSEG